MFIIDTSTHFCLISNTNHTKPPYANPPISAKKNDLSENSRYKEDKPSFPLISSSNSKILSQSAVGVFALGFIDAGYSGDWSRIGVVSRGTEDFLKATAFLVVPFCLYVIFSLSKETNHE